MLENTRKIKFAQSNQPIEQQIGPSFIWMAAQPTCPFCKMVFFQGVENYDARTNKITVEHPTGPVKFCPNQGKRLRYTMPSVEVEEV